MKIKATHSSPAARDVRVLSRKRSVAWSRSWTRVRVGSSSFVRVDRGNAADPGAQRYQEQERNRSSDCPGTYPN
jgi:hypothetical protein